jgi:hypothetical protein
VFAAGVASALSWPMPTKGPPKVLPTLSFIWLGTVEPPRKLHEVITPSKGTAYWLLGEVDWSQVRFWLQALELGSTVCPICVAATAPLGAAISAATASVVVDATFASFLARLFSFPPRFPLYELPPG